MSPEVNATGISEVAEARHTDEALLNIRLQLLQTKVFPALIESAAYQGFNNWQQDTTEKLQTELTAAQVVDLPTRSGKSYLMRQMAAASLKEGLVPVIVAHRNHILSEHTAELDKNDISTAMMSLSSKQPAELLNNVNLLSTHSIAVNAEKNAAVATDQVDVVFIDEVHKAMGEKTLAGMRRLFPNAVLITFTATPDYATNRSATDHYGDKIISHSIVEAIKEGKAPPARVFLYKTEDQIDYLDPSNAEFTTRELRRLARSKARNAMIVDMAQDLVQDGRQGLVTTIPGDNLLHAEILATSMRDRLVTLPTGETRPMQVRVMRGTDQDNDDALKAYENGEYDILLYCNLLREGYTTKVASFLLNGWPRTSIVDLTQDIGRILELKEGEMIIADFLDDSIKRQCTAYDVLELDRVTQAVVAESRNRNTPQNTVARSSYMRDLFRPEIVKKLQQIDNVLIEDLRYNTEPVDLYERRRLAFEREEAREHIRQTKLWEKILAKEGLFPEPPDHFGVHFRNDVVKQLVDPEIPQLGYHIPNPGRSKGASDYWSLVRNKNIIVPPIPATHETIEQIMAETPDFSALEEMEEAAIQNDLKWALGYAFGEDLTEREREVIRLHFGLIDDAPLDLEAVGKEFGLTRERIRQIESKALAKLRHPKRSDMLRPFVADQDFRRVHPRAHEAWSSSDERVAYQKRKLTRWILKHQAAPIPQTETKSPPKEVEPIILTNQEVIKNRDNYFRDLPEVISPLLGLPEDMPGYKKTELHSFVTTLIEDTQIGRYNYPEITKFLQICNTLGLNEKLSSVYRMFNDLNIYSTTFFGPHLRSDNLAYNGAVKAFLQAYRQKLYEASVE